MKGSPSESDHHKESITEPLLISNPKGGFKTLPFIVATDAFEKLASYGLTPNMILYLTREYGMEAAEGAQVLFIWSAATYFTPILGAFLADSYVGRYPMIGFGSITSLLGMIMLWSTTSIPLARPPPCVQFSDADTCKSPIALQLLLLYSSFVLMSIGAGGIRSSCLAFGAEQLGQRQNIKHDGILESFFSWYYVAVSLSVTVALTWVVYIQDSMGWKVGFGVPVVLMSLSALSFFLASPLYIKSKGKANLLTGFAKVVLASFRNRSIKLPSQSTDEVYHRTKGTELLVPSENLRFLNKACVIKNPQEDLTPDGRASDPWSLCTVDQVEELKAIIKVIPILSAGMIMSVNVSQSSFLVLQAATMDRHIKSKIEIPAASFGATTALCLAIWIALYDRVIIPLASKIKGKPTRLSLKQRMGIGILFSTASMAACAIVESIRRETAIRAGFWDSPDGVVPISAMWVLPYYILGGLSVAFNHIGQNEFFYTELPKSMSSIATTLINLAMCGANLLASFITSTVDAFTKTEGNSWVSSNINKGHYDYYYWLLAGLSLVNFVYYLACSKAYGHCRGGGGNAVDKGEGFEHECLVSKVQEV